MRMARGIYANMAAPVRDLPRAVDPHLHRRRPAGRGAHRPDQGARRPALGADGPQARARSVSLYPSGPRGRLARERSGPMSRNASRTCFRSACAVALLAFSLGALPAAAAPPICDGSTRPDADRHGHRVRPHPLLDRRRAGTASRAGSSSSTATAARPASGRTTPRGATAARWGPARCSPPRPAVPPAFNRCAGTPARGSRWASRSPRRPPPRPTPPMIRTAPPGSCSTE